ncbi:MAG: antitoxin family protein [Acidobacteria bacterium]|nr:antitoxin family protein [Acidobacteriota bacterium]
MIRELDAVYENGVLRPLEPLPLYEAQKVHITVSDFPVVTTRPLERLIDQRLLAEVRAEVAVMQRHPAIDEVRAALSPIKGNMSEVVVEERGEY